MTDQPPSPFQDPQGFMAWQHEQADNARMKAEDYRRSLNLYLAEEPAEKLLLISNMLSVIAGGHDGQVHYYEGQFDTALQMRFNICPAHGVDHDAEAAAELFGQSEPDGDLGEDEEAPVAPLVENQFTPDEDFDPIHRMLAGEEVDESKLDGGEVQLPEQRKGSDDEFSVLQERMLDQARETQQLMMISVLDKQATHQEIIEHLNNSILTTNIGASTMLNDLETTLCEIWGLDDTRESEENMKLTGFICVNCGLVYPTLQDRLMKAPDDCSGCHSKSRWG